MKLLVQKLAEVFEFSPSKYKIKTNVLHFHDVHDKLGLFRPIYLSIFES